MSPWSGLFAVASQKPKNRIRRRIVRRRAAAIRDVDEARRLDFRMLRNINERRSEIRPAVSIGVPFRRMKRIAVVEFFNILDFAIALDDGEFIIAERV